MDWCSTKKIKVCLKLRRYRNPKKFILLFFTIAVAALSFPLIKSGLYHSMPFIQSVGERLALFSAFSDMPAQSLELLEQRFNSEIFYGDEEIDAPEPNPNPVPSPQPKPQEESSSVPEQGGEASSSGPGEEWEADEGDEETQSKEAPPEIPAQYRGDMIEEDLSGYDSSSYYHLEPGYLRNYTKLDFDDIEEILEDAPALGLGGNGEPQVLIMHTHATEAFERYDNIFYDTRNTWRSTDNNMNMVAVGEELAKTLRENGVNVLHDSTQHDYPSYNGSYERSAETVKGYLEEYPSIKIVLDVHRDAIDRNGTLVRPITTIDGKKAAQLMIIAGSDDGTMNMPNWRDNLRFAAAIQRQAEGAFEHLMRPIFFCYRKYNQDLTRGSLLLEFGSHGNTLEECLYTARLAGQSIAQAIKDLEE
ncbi:MAG: stage II sporulation protein P [Clostridiales bacterium]|nr:MAG: stage II sporulation protein P [Clostridiales bacterium]RGB68933.1 stage II sporulation protein P [Harryflintia acetispora]